MRNFAVLSVAVAFSLLAGCASNGSVKKGGATEVAVGGCEQYEAAVNKAYNFGAHNFYRTYAVSNDLKGARAQLFLIEDGLKGSPYGNFAVNYKAAEEFYVKNITAAKEQGCDTSEYPISPVAVFRKGVAILEARSK